MAHSIDLSKLSDPFPAEDIEWRVSRAGVGRKGNFCFVLAYITARAIQQRLDDVCGPENWRLETPIVAPFGNQKAAFFCGISIKIGDEWITKWDTSEPTNIEAAKGGFSGAMKRAGAQWGIGRYLYHMDEVYADVADEKPGLDSSNQWHYAKLPEKAGGAVYYWKTPNLPGWALPAEPDTEISKDQLNALKTAWRDKFAPTTKSRADLTEGFRRFVTSVCGSFPSADHTCWTQDELNRCHDKIEATTDPGGVSSDVPFDSE
jgi:hypothetical protein